MKKSSPSNRDKIILAQHYMEKNLDQSIHLNQIAKASFLSPFHFHRMFHAMVGITPRLYFEKIKLERAAFLLTVTNYRIADIAWELSYENPESFARSFKKNFQKTPTEFRKQCSRIGFDVSFTSGKENNQLTTNESNLGNFIKRNFENNSIAYFRHIGPWKKSHKLWRKLIDCSLQLGIFKESSQLIGIWYDDPLLVSKENQRFDLGICLPSKSFERKILQEKFGFSFDNIQGTYLCFPYSGDFSYLENVYFKIYKWLADNTNVAISNKPAIEMYKKFPPFYSGSDCALEVCIPINSQD